MGIGPRWKRDGAGGTGRRCDFGLYGKERLCDGSAKTPTLVSSTRPDSCACARNSLSVTWISSQKKRGVPGVSMEPIIAGWTARVAASARHSAALAYNSRSQTDLARPTPLTKAKHDGSAQIVPKPAREFRRHVPQGDTVAVALMQHRFGNRRTC